MVRSLLALTVTLHAMGDRADEVCVVADDEGRPTSADRPCDVR